MFSLTASFSAHQENHLKNHERIHLGWTWRSTSLIQCSGPGYFLLQTCLGSSRRISPVSYYSGPTKTQLKVVGHDVRRGELQYEQFMGLCDTYKLCYSKSQFLASSKTKFGMQRYVQLVDSFQSSRTWAKLRGSASCLLPSNWDGAVSAAPHWTRQEILSSMPRHGPHWSRRRAALLGKMPCSPGGKATDDEVAARPKDQRRNHQQHH